MTRKRTILWISIAAGVAIAAAVWLSLRHWRPRWSTIQGAVIRRDADPDKESPIAGVLITASHGNASLTTLSGADGFFQITFPGTVLPGQTVDITLRHRDYQTLEVRVPIRFRSSLRQLVVAAMMPVTPEESNTPKRPVYRRFQHQSKVHSEFPQRRQHWQRSKDVSGRQSWRRSLPSPKPMFSRWILEGINPLSDPGRWKRQRVQRRASILYCGTMSFHADRLARIYQWGSHHCPFGDRLVRHSNFSGAS